MAKIEEIVENDNSSTVAHPKINNANLGELKATTDDAIAPVLAIPRPILDFHPVLPCPRLRSLPLALSVSTC